MSVRRVKAGTTDVSVIVRIVDSTDGTPETGVVFNTSGIDLWYRRDGAASVDITEATLSALTDAHSDGGFLHVNDGWYRLDLPDAACASGVAGVQIGGTVTGMVVLAPYIELPVNTAEDVYTRLGAPAGASTAADIAAVKSDTAAILVDTGTTLQGELDGIQADTEDIQSRLPAALVGGRIDATVDGTGMEAGAVTAIQSGLATSAALATVDTVVDAIKAKTDSLTFTTAGIVDANVQQINDVTITGDGQVGTEFGVA